jgi:predicted DNA-binding transcriptional regulator AlpA
MFMRFFAHLSDPVLLRHPDAARLVSISSHHLWQLTHDWCLRAVKLGPHGVRYAMAELRHWINAQPGRAHE